MPWITEGKQKFWIPEIIPEPTEEYQSNQSKKTYLTRENKERMHPGWTYAETIAYVDDEYLFQNEGWKVVVGEKPSEPILHELKKHYIKNSPNQWNEIDERTVEVTYTLSGWIPQEFPEANTEYQQGQREKKYLTPQNEEKRHPQYQYALTEAYVDDEYLFQNEGWKVILDEEPSVRLKNSVRNLPKDWEQIDEKSVRVTYTLVDFNEQESADFAEQNWMMLRSKRDVLLLETDWIIIKSMEKNLIVSQEVNTYRQKLRDLPQTVVNILEFDISDDTLWPIKPLVYFEA